MSSTFEVARAGKAGLVIASRGFKVDHTFQAFSIPTLATIVDTVLAIPGSHDVMPKCRAYLSHSSATRG